MVFATYKSLRWVTLLGLVCWLGVISYVFGAEGDFVAQAQKAYEEAKARYQKDSQNLELEWQFAKAIFDLAEFATNKTQRATLAEQGIAVCQRALVRHPDSVALHYYLAMNLGQLARTRGLGALRLVDEMEREFLRARQLDEHFDYAGADRNLGQLYRDAPSFGSIGSRVKARQFLERAAAVAPNYPDNRLQLIEAHLKWGNRTTARSELEALEQILPAAHKEFAGAEWGASWADWNQDLEKLEKKLEMSVKKFTTPKQQ